MTPIPELLTTREVADATGRSHGQVSALVKAGSITAVGRTRKRGILVFTPDVIEAVKAIPVRSYRRQRTA